MLNISDLSQVGKIMKREADNDDDQSNMSHTILRNEAGTMIDAPNEQSILKHGPFDPSFTSVYNFSSSVMSIQ